MKNSILKISLLLIVFCSAANTFGQNFKAQYSYDANGNRILANVVYLSPAAPPQNVEDKIEVDQEKLPIAIVLYPNPTKGTIVLEISNATDEQITDSNSWVKVWDAQGRLLFEQKKLQNANTLDLSGYADGVYIVHLSLQNTTKTYKVVKRN